MSERYRKWGRSVRRDGDYLVWVDEAGEAIEEHGVFRTKALADLVDLPSPDEDAVDAAAQEIESIIKRPLMIERLYASEGIVAHQCGEMRWRETTRRVHLSVARPPLRALIDLSEFRFDVVRRVAEALLRAGPERRAPRHIRFAEQVGAALLPSVRVSKTQSPVPHDGKGQPIFELAVSDQQPSNWFRPSYRLRPRRAWFHLRVASFGRVDQELPEAIALLAPIGQRTIRVLIADGDDVYPTTVQMRPIAAARPTATWYPYGAGAFGAELML